MAATETKPIDMFTPGPWHVERDGASKLYVSSEMGSIVRIQSPFDDESEPNARLIAAAPELLQACRAVLCAIGDSGAMTGDTFRAVCEIRAAIAKAEGSR